MCYNCGCGMPNDNMGDPNNITESTIEKAAKASSMSTEDSKKEILKTLKKQLGETN